MQLSNQFTKVSTQHSEQLTAASTNSADQVKGRVAISAAAAVADARLQSSSCGQCMLTKQHAVPSIGSSKLKGVDA